MLIAATFLDLQKVLLSMTSYLHELIQSSVCTNGILTVSHFKSSNEIFFHNK